MWKMIPTHQTFYYLLRDHVAESRPFLTTSPSPPSHGSLPLYFSFSITHAHCFLEAPLHQKKGKKKNMAQDKTYFWRKRRRLALEQQHWALKSEGILSLFLHLWEAKDDDKKKEESLIATIRGRTSRIIKLEACPKIASKSPIKRQILNSHSVDVVVAVESSENEQSHKNYIKIK